MINSVMDVPPPKKKKNLLLITLWNCVVCTSLKRTIMIYRKVNKLVKPAEFFCSSKCHGFTDIVWSQTVKLCPSDRRNAKFWKGVYKFLPSAAALLSHLILNVEQKKRRRRRKKKNLPTSLSSDNTLPMWHLTFGDFPFSLIIHCLDHVN